METNLTPFLHRTRRLIFVRYGFSLGTLVTIAALLAYNTVQLLPPTIERWLNHSCANGTCTSSNLAVDALFISIIVACALAMTAALPAIAAYERLYARHFQTRPQLVLVEPFLRLYGQSLFVCTLLIGLTIVFA
jgi:hypothetical protein